MRGMLLAVLCLVAVSSVNCDPLLDSFTAGADSLAEILHTLAIPDGTTVPLSLEELRAKFPRLEDVIGTSADLDIESLKLLLSSQAASQHLASLNTISEKLVDSFDAFKEGGAAAVNHWGDFITLAHEMRGNLEVLSRNEILPAALGRRASIQNAVGHAARSSELLAVDAAQLKAVLEGTSLVHPFDVENLVENFKADAAQLAASLQEIDSLKHFSGISLGTVGALGRVPNPMEEFNVEHFTDLLLSLSERFELPSAHLLDQPALDLLQGQSAWSAFPEALSDLMEVQTSPSVSRDVAGTINSLKDVASSYKDWFSVLKNESGLLPLNHSEIINQFDVLEWADATLEQVADKLWGTMDNVSHPLPSDILSNLGLNKTMLQSIVVHDLLVQLGVQRSVENLALLDMSELKSKFGDVDQVLEKLTSLASTFEGSVMTHELFNKTTETLKQAVAEAEDLLQLASVVEQWTEELGLDWEGPGLDNFATFNLTSWWQNTTDRLEDLVEDKNISIADFISSAGHNNSLVKDALHAVSLFNNSAWNLLDVKNLTIAEILEHKGDVFDLIKMENPVSGLLSHNGSRSVAEMRNGSMLDISGLHDLTGNFSLSLGDVHSLWNLSSWSNLLPLGNLSLLWTNHSLPVPELPEANWTDALSNIQALAEELKKAFTNFTVHSNLSSPLGMNFVLSVRDLYDSAENDYGFLGQVEFVDQTKAAIESIFREALLMSGSGDIQIVPAMSLLPEIGVLRQGILPDWSIVPDSLMTFDLVDVGALNQASEHFAEYLSSGLTHLNMTLPDFHKYLNSTSVLELADLEGLTDWSKEDVEEFISHLTETGESLLEEFDMFKPQAEAFNLPISAAMENIVSSAHHVLNSTHEKLPLFGFAVDLSEQVEPTGEGILKRVGSVGEALGSLNLPTMDGLPTLGGGDVLGRLRGGLQNVAGGNVDAIGDLVHNLLP